MMCSARAVPHQAYCQQHGIVYESYGAMRGCPFGSAAVQAIAASHKASVAQICIKWALQRGTVVAAGTGANASTVGPYAKENLGALAIGALTAADMMVLDNLQLP